MANFVKSVEYLEITLPSNTAVSVDLTKSQVIDNCIPYYTANTNSTVADVNSRRYCEVYFTSGTPNKVTAHRNNGTGEVIVGVFVVEYDPAVVTVQQGTWVMTGVDTLTASIDAVTLTKAYVVINWRSTDGGDRWRSAACKVKFNTTTQLRFDRGATAANILGRWYVLSTTGTDFSVIHATIAMASGDETKTVSIGAITLASTFVIMSHETSEASDDVVDGGVVGDMESTTLVRARRAFNDFGDATPDGAAASTVDLEVQVVSAGGSEFAVQRGECNWGDALTKANTINAIDQARAIIIAGGHQGAMSCNETSSADLSGNYGILSYTANTTVTGTRAQNTSPDGTTMFEAIEFGLTGAGGVVIFRRRIEGY